MIRGIDHLVVACPDPDAAASELESALGIASTGGGRHAGRGSWNRIAWFADGSYLEFIGIEDADLARRSPVGAAAVRALEERGGGLATYALSVDDLDATATALRSAGSSLGPVTHGSRTRDDGELVEWWTAFPASDLAPDAPGFLIEHARTGAEWGPEALAARARFAHPIGSPVALTTVEVATDEPEAVAAAIHDALGLEARATADQASVQIASHVLRLIHRRSTALPAAVTLTADVETPRHAELLGLRFSVEGVAAG